MSQQYSRSAPAAQSLAQVHARRRSMQSRGDTELLIFERIDPAYSDEGESDEEMTDWQGGAGGHPLDSSQNPYGGNSQAGPSGGEQAMSESESDEGEEADEAAGMSMDEDERPAPEDDDAGPSQSRREVLDDEDRSSIDEARFKAPAVPKRKLDKGKGRALPPATTTAPLSVTAPAISELERQKERERMAREREETRAERRASLSSRRPVILLRRDSGFCFSTEALMPSYLRERYTTSTLSASAGSSSTGSHAFEDDDEAQPACVDIYVSQEDSRRILPLK